MSKVLKRLTEIQLRFLGTDARGTQIIFNILFSFLIKGGSIGISVIILPLTISYVSSLKYGIWVTISSVLGWFTLFDIGLGNGLRNKFVEARSINDIELAKKLVSTTYAIITLIATGLCVMFFLFKDYLNYAKLFNAPKEFEEELSILFPILFIFFNIQLILTLINTVLTADHKLSKASLITFLGSLLGLISIYIIGKFYSGSLLILGLILSGSPLIVLLLANLTLFLGEYRSIAPSIAFIDFHYSKSLLKLGGSFFIIQIAGLIIFSSTNFVIAHLLGPIEVTKYNIAFKYFSVFILLFNIVLGPYWSAFTEAYFKQEFSWIKRTIRKLITVWLLLGLLVVFMLLFSPFIYEIWIGPTIEIEFELSAFIALFVLISTWNNIFSFFLNGIGKIRLQLYLSVLVSIINIPLAIFFSKYLGFGVNGIILATSSCLFISSIVSPIQYFKIISNQATGIWNK